MTPLILGFAIYAISVLSLITAIGVGVASYRFYRDN